jgi:TetR/AcrR family transcriptional regulator, cholesterol catabolism regulator
MVSTRNTRQDVVAAAGRLFAERGYHGTSMRELGRQLGLLGGSLYAHVDSKQDLLVEVVEEGARLFEASAEVALASSDDPKDRLRALIRGHVAVIVDNIDVARTFLNEARVLDGVHRARIVEARDRYEAVFRSVLAVGAASGAFRPELDPRTDAIFILSILNALERWYSPAGSIDPKALADRIFEFAYRAVAYGP